MVAPTERMEVVHQEWNSTIDVYSAIETTVYESHTHNF